MEDSAQDGLAIGPGRPNGLVDIIYIYILYVPRAWVLPPSRQTPALANLSHPPEKNIILVLHVGICSEDNK